MIRGLNPVLQALLGTIFTWGVTALGSALVFICHGSQRKFLDSSLGFAAGVMTAASFWSLLEPSIEHAKLSGFYGPEGRFSFLPAVVGFILGALFVVLADHIIPVVNSSQLSFVAKKEDADCYDLERSFEETSPNRADGKPFVSRQVRTRNRTKPDVDKKVDSSGDEQLRASPEPPTNWKRIVLLIVAITVHNIPEGLAVGVGFGSVGKTPSSTFAKSRNLAIGIGIQNFPEGMAVSIPLRASGMSSFNAFWYGQLSGMVEPIFGVLGALCVTLVEPLLPYVLAFAAGAMIFVVFDDIVPEAHSCGNGRISSFGAVFGFVAMMTLDVGLG